MLERYGGLIWLVVFVATYGGIYAMLAREDCRYRERALREWYAGVDDGDRCRAEHVLATQYRQRRGGIQRCTRRMAGHRRERSRMSIPEWADRSVPLAKRVELSHYDWDMTDETERHRAELVADVRAADELARATDAFEIPDELRSPADVEPIAVRFEDSLTAYRERMGVQRG